MYMPEMGEVTADTTASAHPSVGDEEVSLAVHGSMGGLYGPSGLRNPAF